MHSCSTVKLPHDQNIKYDSIFVGQEFFLNVKDLTRHLQTNDQPIKQFNQWTSLESKLQKKLNDAKNSVHIALCDNIDTRTALDVIRELVTQTNIYVRDMAAAASTPVNALLLRRIALYVTDILHIFGAITGPRGGLGFPVESAGVDVSAPSLYISKLLYPYSILRRHSYRSAAGTNCNTIPECNGRIP